MCAHDPSHRPVARRRRVYRVERVTAVKESRLKEAVAKHDEALKFAPSPVALIKARAAIEQAPGA